MELLGNAQDKLVYYDVEFLCATQEIGVDGIVANAWSVVREYNAGSGTRRWVFFSKPFTIFLAFGSAEFVNKYFRAELSNIQFLSLTKCVKVLDWVKDISCCECCDWGMVKKEKTRTEAADGISGVYKRMCRVMKIIWNLQALDLVLMITNIGLQTNETVTNLEILQQGFNRGFFLVNGFKWFFRLRCLYIMRPLRPWMVGYIGRVMLGLDIW